MESTNGQIKADGTHRERKPLGEFLYLLENTIVFNWSFERCPDCPTYQGFAEEPTIPNTTWDDAFKWMINNKVHVLKQNGVKYYF